MVDGMSWGGPEHAQIGWRGSVVAIPFDIWVLPIDEKWHGEGFWRRWLRGHHAAEVFWRRQQEAYKGFGHQAKHLRD